MLGIRHVFDNGRLEESNVWIEELIGRNGGSGIRVLGHDAASNRLDVSVPGLGRDVERSEGAGGGTGGVVDWG
jgi:hypothetical protein